ncbi:hypothetical protein LTR10_015223 [Elasticomyces elasticus]|uniref:DNA (cytosine-5-)-methyltransferase n=1 Tax=Exophiala sideris TaxID=1016849 RepID=A0ABR0JFV9_9EURO|nr:hypothetical protein LTR10_015223 [Elasticomyces elasticus]KAK5032698.1 hypothetical protein LTS07_004108 [Exophiala sideris]KAK5037122.1 hypothetical protein LTR13_004927 [Exophiala sideris]KAK5062222.1 hypothetical protein LTR69_004580 [Exophiala sideris]KAK5182280.1 hypothetical protein LTR44_005291 [Eurotiomycetes sp. CCFEE 6388]
MSRSTSNHSRRRSHSPGLQSSNASPSRHGPARPQNGFPSSIAQQARPEAIIDLTQSDEEGSQQSPYDLTRDVSEDLEVLVGIEDRNRAAGYGSVDSVQVGPGNWGLTQNMLATYHELEAKHRQDVELKDGTFMRISAQAWDDNNEGWIIGRRLFPQGVPGLLLPQAANELVWMSYCDNNADEYYRTVRVREADILRECKIIFTNVPHSMLNISHVRYAPESVFFCRWKRIQSLEEKTQKGMVNKQKAGKVEVIDVVDADTDAVDLRQGGSLSPRMAPAAIRRLFRGPENCKLGGSSGSGAAAKYSYADFFCGAGGASQAAHDAGLALQMALDFDKDAIQTYTSNFARPGLEIREVAISDFIRDHAAEKRIFLVDILHASPPCQPFSPANTTPNEALNEMNEASFTAVSDILKICKPRVVTLEETEGILRGSSRDFFQALISYFVELGYSLQWKAVEMMRYGVPQTRSRLILIASGPGEKLPPFPAATHGPGLQPFPTIAQAIGNIRPHPMLHDEEGTYHFRRPRRPFDANRASGTITCGGGASDSVYHPAGLRKYTPAELLAIQTFPATFRIAGTLGSMRKQIGNAVPPKCFGVIFRGIAMSLKNTDTSELSG